MLSDVPSHPHERVLPSGTLELVINLAEDEFRIYDPADSRRIQRYSGAVISRNEIERGPGGTQILLDDPDGNPIELHQNPP
jgi:hypothetical protein